MATTEKQCNSPACGFSSTESSGSSVDLSGSGRQQLDRFLRYNFVDDATFVAGWKKIRDRAPTSVSVDQYLEAKLYYYGSIIEPIPENVRKSWKGLLSHQQQGGTAEIRPCGSLVDADKCIDSVSCRTEERTASLDSACLLPPPGHLPSSTLVDSAEPDLCLANVDNTAAPYPTSFAQVLKIVSAGQELPGIEHLAIAATNSPPTASTMQQPLKPWERIASSAAD